MFIEYGCVRLRSIELKDSVLLADLLNNPEIDGATLRAHLPISYEQEEDWIKNYHNTEKDIRLMIELNNKKTIGMISLTDINYKNRTAELGYKITSEIDGRIRGDTKDALIALLNFAFYELGLNCITGQILVNNNFSLKLAKKVGFQEEGLLRERIFSKGIFLDVYAVSLLKKDFEQLFGFNKKIN